MKSSEQLSDLGPGFLLVQNYARPHVDKFRRQFLHDEGIGANDWPSYSPDLQPIEDLFNRMGYVSVNLMPPSTATDCP